MKHIFTFLARVFRNALLAPPDERLLQRSLLNYLLAISGSIVLIGIAVGIAALAGTTIEELSAVEVKISIWDFWGTVVFVPLLETLLLAGLLALMPCRWGIVPRAIVSAIIWGGLHGVRAPFWFFGTVFSFFVYSCCYMVWRQKSFACGFAAAALPHAINNLVAFTLIAILNE